MARTVVRRALRRPPLQMMEGDASTEMDNFIEERTSADSDAARVYDELVEFASARYERQLAYSSTDLTNGDAPQCP